MLKKSLNLIAIGLVAAFIAGASISVHAEDKPAAPTEGKKEHLIPFSGKINEIDKAAKTIAIGKEKQRTIHITDMTKIKKDGKAATLTDAKVGDDVGGSYRKSAAGKMEAVSLRIGAKPEGEVKTKPGEKKKKE